MVRCLLQCWMLSALLLSGVGCDSSAPEITPKPPVSLPDSLYANPVFDRDFPDPTVIRGQDGYFYAYATETVVDGKWYNIQVARSEDLVSWTHYGDALPGGVTWAATGHAYWAPHVLYAPEQERYVMYFSAHHDARGGKCLTTAISESPTGPFVAAEEPLLCGPGFDEIDAMAFDDPKTGKKWLYWGSGGRALRVRELADDRRSFREDAPVIETVLPRQDAAYSNLLEGSWVVYREPYYYLYYSGDNCCGPSANYAVMVARSESATGPFVRKGAADGSRISTILAASGIWLAPGHNSVIRDDAGEDWMVYHAINRGQPTRRIGIGDAVWDRRVMLMDRIQYTATGWPYVDGSRPSERSIKPVIN